MLRQFFLPRLIYYTYRLLSWSWQVKVLEHPEMTKLKKQGTSMIFASWHRDELALVQLVGVYNIATMISTSNDGRLMNYITNRLGGKASRGSSTREGVRALKGLIRLVKSGRHASITVDGPKGPIYEVKPGIFELSRLTKAPIVCLSAYSENKWLFKKAWNKTYLPKPFSRIYIYFSEPKLTVSMSQDPKEASLAKALAQGLDNAHRQARKKIARQTR